MKKKIHVWDILIKLIHVRIFHIFFFFIVIYSFLCWMFDWHTVMFRYVLAENNEKEQNESKGKTKKKRKEMSNSMIFKMNEMYEELRTNINKVIFAFQMKKIFIQIAHSSTCIVFHIWLSHSVWVNKITFFFESSIRIWRYFQYSYKYTLSTLDWECLD